MGDPLSEGVTGAVQCIIAGAVESARKFKGNVCSLKLQEKYSIVLVKNEILQFLCYSYVFDKDALLSQSSLGHPKVYFLVGASNDGVSYL